MPHWLVRPHGAVVEPRGRQRVKVPKRCAEMCTHVPSHHLWCLYLYKVECKLYRFNFRMYVFFVTCWLKRNYAIGPSKDNANNSKIVAVTKLDIQWQGGAQAMVMMVLFCTFNFRNGLYIYIYTPIHLRTPQRHLCSKLVQKKGVVFDGHTVEETTKTEHLFGSTKTGVGICDSRLYFGSGVPWVSSIALPVVQARRV